MTANDSQLVCRNHESRIPVRQKLRRRPAPGRRHCRHVNLRRNKHFATDDLAMLSALPNFTELDVSRTSVGSPAVEQNGKLHWLTTLDVTDTGIIDNSLVDLAGLVNLNFRLLILAQRFIQV